MKYKRMVFSISEVCSNGCKYCDFPKIQKKAKHSSIENINALNKIIEENISILEDFDFFVEGGEIGEVPEEIVDYWFKNTPITKFFIHTNGTFIKKGYNKKYSDKIYKVFYHLNPIRDIIKFEEVILVISQKNFLTVKKIIEDNRDITFELYLESTRKDTTLKTNKAFLEIIKKFVLSSDNVNKSILSRLNHISKEGELSYDRRLFCANDYIKPLIDVTNMQIQRCMTSFRGDRIRLNSQNFKKLIDNSEKLFPLIEPRCNMCTNGKIFYNFDEIKRNKEDIFKIKEKIKNA